MTFLPALAFAALLLLQAEPRAIATFDGAWKSGDRKQLYIALDSGETMRMLITRTTRFFRAGQPARVTDFHEGDKVTVDAERDLYMNLLAVRVDLLAVRVEKKSEGKEK